jgi:pimeloyl-ACP methyl ester carboxylesterase
MKVSFQRLTTKDGLELHGLLFEPDKKTTKAIIHVHGWVGNFYENKFIDYIAKEAISKGFALLTFNNRGAGIVNDFIKRKGKKLSYVRIGGSLEKFEDCIFDIKSAIDFLSKNGYKKIVLEGHSLGCQKATFYKYKTKDKRVQRLILLAPVDDVSFTKSAFKSKYKESLKIAREMIKKGKGDRPVPKWMAFYELLNAKMFLNVADPESTSGSIFDFSGDLKEIKNVNCQVLVIFGSKDDYQSSPEEKLRLLKRKVKNCDIELVRNAGHGFTGFEDKLSKLIANWL